MDSCAAITIGLRLCSIVIRRQRWAKSSATTGSQSRQPADCDPMHPSRSTRYRDVPVTARSTGKSFYCPVSACLDIAVLVRSCRLLEETIRSGCRVPETHWGLPHCHKWCYGLHGHVHIMPIDGVESALPPLLAAGRAVKRGADPVCRVGKFCKPRRWRDFDANGG